MYVGMYACTFVYVCLRMYMYIGERMRRRKFISYY